MADFVARGVCFTSHSSLKRRRGSRLFLGRGKGFSRKVIQVAGMRGATSATGPRPKTTGVGTSHAI